MGPILVVCLTNHALDSFLEGLLDAGGWLLIIDILTTIVVVMTIMCLTNHALD